MIYFSGDSSAFGSRWDEIHKDKSRISLRPNEAVITDTLQKRIRRSDSLSGKKNTLSMCVALLLSRECCITSYILKLKDNEFIERCWECIQATSYKVADPASRLMKDCMEDRSPFVFSSMFCEQH